jgi:hypothetical protein
MPNCQAIVKRYKDNRWWGDFNAGREVSPPTVLYCWKKEPTQAGEDTPECQTIVKRYKDNKGMGEISTPEQRCRL